MRPLIARLREAAERTNLTLYGEAADALEECAKIADRRANELQKGPTVGLVQIAWSWNNGTPQERGDIVRRLAFGGKSIQYNLRSLFNLTDEGLGRILDGDIWRPEYSDEETDE